MPGTRLSALRTRLLLRGWTIDDDNDDGYVEDDDDDDEDDDDDDDDEDDDDVLCIDRHVPAAQ